METINKQVLRVLRLLGDDTAKSIRTTVGAEQEYFLIKKDHFKQRKDLIFTGRTLFGAKPPKGQELDDHYFGAIKPCVLDFMSELDDELWKLGILAKTEHNEAAPAQHELAPIYDTANIAADHNQLTMEIMKKVAYKHDLTCLLHEKPFAGVNGSGKHNNWSIITDTGENLFEAGDKPERNTRFLLFLAAVIKAVDEYQDLLRISVASAGNDHRLGGGEAPPAIISIFIGDELGEVVNSIIDECEYLKTEQGKMVLGAKVIPQFKKDTTDRNRTSPFAFTGNKFEFRMVGSAFSVSGPNFVLNTIVAEILSQFADYMESMDDLELATSTLISNVFKNHSRILFNGNNYSDEWVKEAEKRGLLNLMSTADALPYYICDKNVQLFEKHKIFTKDELYSRYEILIEMYCKTLKIEALTMIDMVKKDIIPAVSRYANDLCVTATNKKQLSLNCKAEESVAKEISDLSASMYDLLVNLENNMNKITELTDYKYLSEYYRDAVIPSMNELREVVDALEVLVGTDYWPYPSYAEMLFNI